MRRMIAVLFTALLALNLTACGEKQTAQSCTVYAMDTVMKLTAYGEGAQETLRAAEKKLYALDAQLSRHREGSSISVLNSGGSLSEADGDAYCLLDKALAVSEATDGFFDPTVAPQLDLWNIGGDTPHVPSEEELAAVLPSVGAGVQVKRENGSISLFPGAQIDLGGIAKGYAGEVVCELLRNSGVTSAVIDLGGDVCLLGKKPGGLLQNPTDWTIALKDPADSSAFIATLTLSNTFVVTSGIYERCFTEGGVLYHHILDPKTGRCADTGLTSVSVICMQGSWADALSTAVFVMGRDRALALRDALRGTVDFEVIFVTVDGRVLYTDGLAGRINPQEEGKYSYEALT